ncbi:DMT family transporter [Desulforhopalus singaporensis]|uniref:O-acetylserine/cysteine efflux transporter n=1 Tax=Desulforhopalus singaporensis TaxID=91360 RepID=A0A1H0MFX2_9BACT|nr:DMT family transporter [Desulforhopalus singaporensis]SDO79241.1 O-acetylserine/cysteine efflux transporter [Desulforhopalus singaporensis]
MNPFHLVLALIANCAWGFNFIAGKIGADHFQPLLFTSFRFLFLLLIMLPWLRPAPGYMKPLLRVAFLLGVGHFSMMFIGLNGGGNIASIAITTQLYVPFSAILAAILLKERIPMIKILAIATAFLGIIVIGFDPIVFNHLNAVFWVLGAAFLMAVSTVLMRRFPDMGVFRLQAWIALVATPSLLLLSLIFESGQLQLLENLQLFDLWTVCYSAVGASVIGHGILYYLLGRYTVATVTPLMLLAPLLASIFGIWWFGDQLGWRLVVGGTLTMGGILLVSIKIEKLTTLFNIKDRRFHKK